MPMAPARQCGRSTPPSRPPLQPLSTVPGAAAGRLVCDGEAAGAGPGPVRTRPVPRSAADTGGTASATAAATASTPAPTLSLCRRCRRMTAARSPGGAGSVAPCRAARSLRSKSLIFGSSPVGPCSAAMFAQPRERTGCLTLHRALRAAKNGRRLSFRQVLQVAKDDDGTLPGRQRRQCPQQLIAVGDSPVLVGDRLARVRGRDRHLGPAPQPPPAVHRSVDEHPADVALGVAVPADPRPPAGRRARGRPAGDPQLRRGGARTRAARA